MRRCLWVCVLVGACGTSLPPERLVSVDAELARGEVSELAETQPGAIGEARLRRDAAWKAWRAGDTEGAALNAWLAWQRLRVADNLDALSRAAALEAASEPVAAPVEERAAGPGEPRVDAPPAPEAAPADGPSKRVATRAVQNAEDARLRLVVTGGQDDWRWPEAEALLQTSQRALERGSWTRAEQLADRALVVFELVRLSRGPEGKAAAREEAAAAPAGRPLPAPSRAYVEATVKAARARLSAGAAGCVPDVDAADALLKQAEQRRLAGDPGGGDAPVAIAAERLKRCDALLAAQVARRISPLRDAATAAAKGERSPEARTRLTRLIARADELTADGDLAAAEALLNAVVGAGADLGGGFGFAGAEGLDAPPTKPAPAKEPVALPTIAPVLAPVVAPTVAAPAPTTPAASPPAAAPAPTPAPGPKSRIVSERLEPLPAEPAPPPDVRPDEAPPPAP